MNTTDHFHAHIYFDSRDPQQTDLARQLRQQLSDRFGATIGSLHLQAIGPHPKPMFQALFNRQDFGHIVTWLMRKRCSLSVLVHEVTGNNLLDHTQHILWLGPPLVLRLEALN